MGPGEEGPGAWGSARARPPAVPAELVAKLRGRRAALPSADRAGPPGRTRALGVPHRESAFYGAYI